MTPSTEATAARPMRKVWISNRLGAEGGVGGHVIPACQGHHADDTSGGHKPQRPFAPLFQPSQSEPPRPMKVGSATEGIARMMNTKIRPPASRFILTSSLL